MIEKQISKLTRPFEGPLKTEDLANMFGTSGGKVVAPTHDSSPAKRSPLEETGERQEKDARRLKTFEKAIRNLDEYLPENLKMFSKATEELILEMMDKMVEELDRGAG
ncbi:unnamed protein product [Sphagnum balticum]